MIYIVIPTTKERRPQTDRLLASIREHTKVEHSVVLYENSDGGWVVALRKVLAGINGLAFLVGCDCVVHDGWDIALIEGYLKAYPNGEGVVEPYNELHHGKLCQHPFGHTEVLLQYLDPDFIHNFSDNWMTERLNEKGLYTYIPESKIEHMHHVNKKAEMDETYKTVNASYAKDAETYQRKTREYNDNIKKKL